MRGCFQYIFASQKRKVPLTFGGSVFEYSQGSWNLEMEMQFAFDSSHIWILDRVLNVKL